MDTCYRNGIPSSRSRIAVNQLRLPHRPLLGYMMLVHCCILRVAACSRESRRRLFARYPPLKPARCDSQAGFTLYATDDSCRRSALEQFGHSLERRLYVLVRRWWLLGQAHEDPARTSHWPRHSRRSTRQAHHLSQADGVTHDGAEARMFDARSDIADERSRA